MNTLVLNRLENKLHKGTQFSVIIPAHNAEKTLRRAVESVLKAMETVAADAVISSRLKNGEGNVNAAVPAEAAETEAAETGAERLDAETPAEDAGPGIADAETSEEGAVAATAEADSPAEDVDEAAADAETPAEDADEAAADAESLAGAADEAAEGAESPAGASGAAAAQADAERLDAETPAGAFGAAAADAHEVKAAPLFEILIIENGSEDATEFTARLLETEYANRVRLLKSDKGVSNARNRGLDEASGKWILFLDADDYLLDGAGEVLRDALHFTGTDLIVCSYEAGNRVLHVCPPQGERFSGQQIGEILTRMIENPTRYTSVWTKLFRRDCIERAGLRFDPSLRLSEDSLFVIRYLAGCRRIRLIDRPFYHYSTEGGSVVRTWDGSKEEGYKNALFKAQEFLKKQPREIREAGAGYGMMQFNLLMVREVFSAYSPLTAEEKIDAMTRIAAEEPFASVIKAYDPKRHKGARYLPFYMLRRGAPLGAAAIFMARAMQNARRESRG